MRVPTPCGEGNSDVRVICAYCEREGKPGIIRDKEPFHVPLISHGICLTHQRQLEEQLRGAGG